MAIEGLTPTKTTVVFTDDDAERVCGERGLQEARDMGILCRKGGKAVQFFHKTGQEYCTSVYLCNDMHRLNSYLQDVKTIKDALSIAPVLTFAASSKSAASSIIDKLKRIFSSKSAASAIIDKLMRIFSSEVQTLKYYKKELPFDETRTIQRFIQLCLECNFEAHAQSKFTSIIKDLFDGGEVLFYGISPKAAMSLAYYMTYCDPDAIQHITLRPTAHVSEPMSVEGPNMKIYSNALQSMKSFPVNKIQQLYDSLITSTQDLHNDWKRFGCTEVTAYMSCIQAYEGLTRPLKQVLFQSSIASNVSRYKVFA